MPQFLAHPEAREEFRADVRFYDEVRPGYGQKFHDAIEAALVGIKQFPLWWPVRRGEIRSCPVRGFPYRILYAADEQGIYVVAFAHGSRHPDYWLKRLADLKRERSEKSDGTTDGKN